MWPITPREAQILSGLTPGEFYRRVKRAKEEPAEIAMTLEGAKVYRLERGEGKGFALDSYDHDGGDARMALTRLNRILAVRDRLCPRP